VLTRLLAIVFVEQVATNATRPMVVYRALDLGASPFDLGLIMAAYAVVAFVASLLGGHWVERSSERWVSLGGTAAIIVGFVLLLAGGSIAMLALSQAAVGLGQTLLILSGQSLLARFGIGPDGGFGLYSAAASVGQLTGPLMATHVATWFARDDLEAAGTLVFAGSAVAGLLILAVSAGLPNVRQPVDEGTKRGRLPSPAVLAGTLRVPLMGHAMAASMVVTASTDLLITYLPAFGAERGWSVQFVGLLLAARAAASMVVRLFTAPLMRYLGRKKVLVISMGAPGALLMVVPFVEPPVACFVLICIAGFWLGLGAPVTMHWVGVLSPPNLRATTVGMRLAGNRLSQVAVPVAVGGLGSLAGMGAVFCSIGGGLSAVTVALLCATRDL
jgi:MFS family permease